MAKDSSMTNIGYVEQYGKNLNNVQMQLRQIFSKIKQQTQSVNGYWDDENYDRFSQEFNQNILKKIDETCMTLEIFSKYVDQQCKAHRNIQQNKVNF